MKFILENIHWVLLALLSGGMLVWPALRRGGSGAVSPLNATLMMNKEDAAVIDIRDAEEYAQGHILNARNIPLKDAESRVAELQKYKNKPLVIVCERGARAAGAAALFRKLGFANAVALEGGLAAWRSAGLPTTK